MNGMLSHTEGLIKSALTCLQENLKSGGEYLHVSTCLVDNGIAYACSHLL